MKKQNDRLIRVFLSVLLMMGLVGSTIMPLGFAAPTPEAEALAYLHQIQNKDGGFPSAPGQKSSPSTTAWVVMALKSVNEDPCSSNWKVSGETPETYLKSAKIGLESLNDYSRFTLACTAMGIKPELQGENLTNKILSCQQKNGQFSWPDEVGDQMINGHMWAVLALHSAGVKIKNPTGAKKWLTSAQNKDGGYGWCVGMASDPDDTAVAIQTLVVLGDQPGRSAAIKKALAYLKATHNDDGGYGLQKTSNAASDAWVIQGLMAGGVNTQSVKNHLFTLQSKSGAFQWRPDADSSPVMMTAYALTALSGHAYPVNRTKKVKK